MNNAIFYILLILLIPFAIAWISIAPWVPTSNKDHKRVLDLLTIKKWEKLYEIWCGDGRVSFYLWKNISNEIIWIEINPFLYLYCRVKNFFLKQYNVSFINKNIFNYNLSDAWAIYIYALPQNSNKLVEKFQKELKKWTRIISYVFELSWLQLIEKNKPSKEQLSIYVYEI